MTTKILAKYTGIGISKTGAPEARFKLTETALNALKGVDIGEYEVEIKKPRNKRSLNQNALLWELIGNISFEECGSYAESERIYIQILEMAGAKCTFVMVPTEAVEKLRSMVRHVVERDERVYNGVNMTVVQCFEGTSKMNTEEMSKVIDAALRYANERNIDSGYWKEKFGYADK